MRFVLVKTGHTQVQSEGLAKLLSVLSLGALAAL